MMRLGWLGPHYAIALCLLLSVGSKMGTAQDRSKAERVIAIAENAKSTNRWIRQTFETVHVGRRSLDDITSVRAFQLFLDELDPDRAVFLKVDFEAFRKYEKRLDDLFRDDSFEFANLAYGVFLNRLPESFAMAHQQIDAHHDFDIQEDYDTLPQSIAYAHDRADLMERYRKLIKYQFLKLRSAGKSDQEIRNELHLRYQSRKKREINGQPEDMLVRYFTALGHAMDPHTRYMSPEETDAMFGRLTQRQTGIGAALRSENGIIQIQSLVPGGAASLDGRLRPGDSILSVKQSASSDAVELHGMSVEEVAKLIRGGCWNSHRTANSPRGQGYNGVDCNHTCPYSIA